ncbi:XRE family transcriptional regulator [Lacibacter luteus]|uniref:XRE family transcriptional regulator n=1 Tax=Lacibacter luteus TaxID=2508719 RepID=A0A4Q1CGL0_9BACT|nr:helix-turn-helix transcriptional regulator [Lacibacter luteus]RXK59183.1 XRE family transcriptional regulator [Lacibacter luteus]
MNFILYSFRRYHQFTKEEISQKLQLSLSEYNAFESESRRIDRKLAAKLSAVYNAPGYVFLMERSTATLQVVFNHNHFENSNGFVQYQNLVTS